MALPKINEHPKYDLIIPSSGQRVKFRPYLVKEEKVLMLAMESEDLKQTVTAIVNTILSCVDEPIDPHALKIFDVEYMFTQIRSKSVGETSDLKLKCVQCDEANPVSVNMEDVKIDIPDVNDTIAITDNITLKMKWPDYTSLTLLGDNLKTVDQLMLMVIMSIEAIQTEEEQFLAKDVSQEELQEFIDSLTTAQFEKIKDYIQAMPSLEHQIEFNCEFCEHHNTMSLKGIQDFF